MKLTSKFSRLKDIPYKALNTLKMPVNLATQIINNLPSLRINANGTLDNYQTTVAFEQTMAEVYRRAVDIRDNSLVLGENDITNQGILLV